MAGLFLPRRRLLIWRKIMADIMNQSQTPDSTETDDRAVPAHRGWILAALMLTMTLAAMDIAIVATAVPQIVGDLGGFNRFSWLFSIYLLAQTVTIPIYGKLADMYGRKPVLIGGTLLFLAGSALCAVAWAMIPLIIFRGLQGLGAGSIMATVNTLAGDLYSVRERARVQGWLSSVWGVAAILGPTLGGAFAEYATWHWVFLINLPIGAAALVLISRYLHEHVAEHRHAIDYPGAILMMLAVIDENHCIGCTLCLQACPVDAIIGANKKMHTVVPDLCTGCKLCIPPCPVDYIQMTPAGYDWTPQHATTARERHHQRQARLKRKHPENQSLAARTLSNKAALTSAAESDVQARQAAIAQALARARERRRQSP